MSKVKMLRFAESADGETLDLPLSMLMQTIFLGGNKGAGKTSAMKRLFEAAHGAGAQCVAIAPLGRWWSLRIAKNGRGRGLKDVFVFGGKHGDVPVTATSGRAVARTVAQKRIHAVLDVELMRKEDRALFVGDFLEELWQLKKEEDASHPFVLFIDEAQTVAPQKSTSKSVERMREFAADLCREGRNHGVGMVLGAQRSANVDKDLLALVEMLIVMRTIHHLDRKVYQSWVDEKSERDDEEGAWLKRLRRLEKGQAYLYAPELNIFERVSVLLPDTFDATATATLGERVAKVGKLSKLDVRKLGEELSAVVAETEANDPAKLRAKVANLEAQLKLTEGVAGRYRGLAEKIGQLKTPATPKLDKRLLKRIERAAQDARKAVHAIEAHISLLMKARQSFVDGAQALDVREKLPLRAQLDEKARNFGARYSMPAGQLYDALTGTTRVQRGAAKFAARHEPKNGTSPVAQSLRVLADARREQNETKLGKGERKVMIAIAQHRQGVTREQITVLTGYKRSTRDAYVARLATAGYVTTGVGSVDATEAGIEWLGGTYQPLPTGDALREHWLAKLPSGEAKILQVLVDEKASLSRDLIGEATGFKRSTRDAYIQRLLARRLVESNNTLLRASSDLFGNAP